MRNHTYKMSSACRFIFIQIKVIFIRMVSYLESFWNRDTRELRNGLLAPIYSKRHLQHDNMHFFSLTLRFMTFFTQARAEMKFLWTRKWPTSQDFFLTFSYHFAAVATSSHKKILLWVFTQISEHFCAYLGLHWAGHSDLSIIGKILTSCRSWL